MKAGIFSAIAVIMLLAFSPAHAASWKVGRVTGSPRVQLKGADQWGALKEGMVVTDSHELDIGSAEEVILKNDTGLDIHLRGVYRIELGRAIKSLLPLRKKAVLRQPAEPISVSGVRGEDFSKPGSQVSPSNVLRYATPVDLWNALIVAIKNGDGAPWRELFAEEMYEDTQIAEFLGAAEQVVAGSNPFIEAYARTRDRFPAPKMKLAREMLPLFVSNFCEAVDVGENNADFRYRLIDEGKNQIIGLPEYFKTAVEAEAKHRMYLICCFTYEYEEENNVVVPYDTDLSPLVSRGIPLAALKDPWGNLYRIEHRDTPVTTHWITTISPSGEKISVDWGVLHVVRARVKREQSALEACVSAFRSAHDTWPTDEEGLALACENEAMRLDPWGNPYTYKREGDFFSISTRMSNGEDVILNAKPNEEKVTITGLGATVTPEGVRFRVMGDAQGSLYLAGEFNGWSVSSHPMIFVNEGGGYWELILKLVPGRYEYKYLTNGNWFADPNAPVSPTSPDGNSLFIIEVAP